AVSRTTPRPRFSAGLSGVRRTKGPQQSRGSWWGGPPGPRPAPGPAFARPFLRASRAGTYGSSPVPLFLEQLRVFPGSIEREGKLRRGGGRKLQAILQAGVRVIREAMIGSEVLRRE